MDAVLLLADSAATDTSNGKVHALGLGWTQIVTPTPPMALIVLIQVPWDQTNIQHQMTIELVDSDGKPALVAQDPATGERQVLKLAGDFEVGRPPGIPRGMSIAQPFSTNISHGMNLQAGQIYEWRLEIDGEHREGWSARFFVARGSTPAPSS